MFDRHPSRRRFLGQLATMGFVGAAGPLWGQTAEAPPTATLALPGGPQGRPISSDFPGKGAMIVQQTRPPVLETPFEIFDKGVFTPNDMFYVHWRWAGMPIDVDPDRFRLTVRGNVENILALTLGDLAKLPKFEIAAVDQDAGNSRGFFQPRVPGIQWGNGAIGNAKWTGARLRDVLGLAGVKAGSVQARFKGMEKARVPDAPDYMKSLDIAHAMDGEVMIATAMNGKPLPLLNGFPIRLIVPGWYSTYWIKMLSDIEILTQQDDNYWMKTADRIPDTKGADVEPGSSGFNTVPIGRMNPRSFITNIKSGESLPVGLKILARGIALGGDTAVAKVELSADGGQSWKAAKLGKDYGKYSFRQWEANFTFADTGPATLMVRCANSNGAVQGDIPNWNPSGYMRNAIESTAITVIAAPPPQSAPEPEPGPDATAPPPDAVAPAPTQIAPPAAGK